MAEAPANDASDASPGTDESDFDGVFKPPIFSFSGGKPVKIAGPGRCVVTDAGLVIEGFKRKWPSHIKTIAVIGLILFVAILALTIPLSIADSGESAVWILALAVPVLLMVLPLIPGYEEHDAEEPRNHTIAWDRVRSVRRGRVSVTIDIAKGRPKGFVYFVPKGDTQGLVTSIRERIRKP